MNTYTAIVERSAPGWAIYIPEVDRHTWAVNLREIEDMARDLVQVMTDQPLDSIHLAIQLPDELAHAIDQMRKVRLQADDADAAAREAQRSAAAALRAAGAPLRDIAAMLGVTYQRVHQVLADADGRKARLAEFSRWVDSHVASGRVNLSVTGDDGSTPVVAVLSDELVPTLIERLRVVGGFANVFVCAGDRVGFMAAVREECTIAPPSDDLSAPPNRPGPTCTVGMFLAYVQNQPNGVLIFG